MFSSGLDNQGVHAQLSDVLLGDVLEALLYHGYLVAPRGSDAHACASLIEMACRSLQRIAAWVDSQGMWESSRDMAALML